MSATFPSFKPVLAFEAVSRSHAGLKRAVNEDRILERSGDGLWAVADGMGGHHHGDLAATRLIEGLAQIKAPASGYAYLGELVKKVDEVNAGLFADSSVETGSTLVALMAYEGHYACVWAGDSRAYLVRDGHVHAITRDHSLVQQLVDRGALAEADRRRHPQAHVITRAVGVRSSIELERRFASIEDGDIFLLCSDGLNACIDDGEIAALLGSRSPNEAADWLLSTALERGAPDNVSFIIVTASVAN